MNIRIAIVTLALLTALPSANAQTANPSVLAFDPPSLAFVWQKGGPNPASQSVLARNCVAYTIHSGIWANTINTDWVTGGCKMNIGVDPNSAKLDVGVHETKILLESNGMKANLLVKITVVSTDGTLQVNPKRLHFGGFLGKAIKEQVIDLNYTGVGTANWTASGPAWLKITKAGGTVAATDPSTLTVGINTDAITAAGRNSGTLTVRDGKTTHEIPVDLTLVPAGSPTIELYGLEVTQGIQNLMNDIPFVANRPTFVRGHVRSLTGDPIEKVTAQLVGTRDGTNLGTLDPINPGGSINIIADPDRGKLGESFLFQLPPTWLTGKLTLHLEGKSQPIAYADPAEKSVAASDAGAASAAPGHISTVAGDGQRWLRDSKGFVTERPNTDGIDPYGMAVDSTGNVYIAELIHHRISKLDTKGVRTIVAGNGLEGFSGDGGPATSASLSSPIDVVVDEAGSLYIADAHNNRIRKVDRNGIISTVAGNGSHEFSGDNGPATKAGFGSPKAVAIDGAGNLYISDFSNKRFRKVDSGGIITTVAGGGADKIDGSGQPATSVEFTWADDAAIDGAGTLYLVDGAQKRIYMVDQKGIIRFVAGTGTGGEFDGDGVAATKASLYPGRIALDRDGNLYITSHFRVLKVDRTGIVTTVAGNGTNEFSGDGGLATKAGLLGPGGVTIDKAGNLHVGDNNRIRKVATSGSAPTTTDTTITAKPDDGTVTLTFQTIPALPIEYHLYTEQGSVTLSDGKKVPMMYTGTAEYAAATSQQLLAGLPIPRVDDTIHPTPSIFPGTRTTGRQSEMIAIMSEAHKKAGSPLRHIYGLFSRYEPPTDPKARPAGGPGGVAAVRGFYGFGEYYTFMPMDTLNMHEIGHNLGRNHVDCGGPANPDLQFPQKDSRISDELTGPAAYYGFNILTREIYPPTHKDYMSYCNPSWVSPYTYKAMMEQLKIHYTNPDGVVGQTAGSPGAPILLVRGSITGAGTAAMAGSVDGVADDNASAAIPIPAADSSKYSMRLLDVNGGMIASYPVTPETSESQSPGGHGHSGFTTYTLAVPRPGKMARVELLHENKPLAERKASANAPTVTLITPLVGQVFANQVIPLTWKAADIDGDELRFNVDYSRDGGDTWHALTRNSSETTLKVDSSRLAGSTKARLRVSANDGFLTTFAVSDAFTVSDHPPVAIILSKDLNRYYVGGQAILLKGTGYDSEEGVVADLTWYSDRNGKLGTGQSLSLNADDLAEGPHIIRLEAKDSKGQSNFGDPAAGAAATADESATARDSVQFAVYYDPPTVPAELLVSSVLNGKILRIEAETGTYAGQARTDSTNKGFEGKGFAAYFLAGAEVALNVTTDQAGVHDMVIRYAAGPHGPESARTLSLYVNGSRTQQVSFERTADWHTWATQTTKVQLASGRNTISFRVDNGDTGYINLDYLELSPNSEGSPVAAPKGAEWVGTYVRDNPENDWHRVTIEVSAGGVLLWKNAAGRSWALEARDDGEIYSTKDCPYGELKLGIQIDEAERFSALLFHGGTYRRVAVSPVPGPAPAPASAPAPAPLNDVDGKTVPPQTLPPLRGLIITKPPKQKEGG